MSKSTNTPANLKDVKEAEIVEDTPAEAANSDNNSAKSDQKSPNSDTKSPTSDTTSTTSGENSTNSDKKSAKTSESSQNSPTPAKTAKKPRKKPATAKSTKTAKKSTSKAKATPEQVLEASDSTPEEEPTTEAESTPVEENSTPEGTKAEKPAPEETSAEKTAKNTPKSETFADSTPSTPTYQEARTALLEAKRQSKATKKAAKLAKKSAKAEKRQQKGTRRGLYITAIILSCLAILCSGGTAGLLIYNQLKGSEPLTIHLDGKDGNSTNFTDNSIAAVANAVAPAVVSILTETRYQSWTGQSASSSSAGTGMIVSPDGYVLTNKHVVEGANSISVQTDAGETYTEVQLVGTDPLNDVAFLKIPKVSDLPTVTLGNSKTINHGQPVVAIGNALGQFQNSVTQGIVSGTGRSIIASDANGEAYESLNDLIQTDASINPGNSGGPLVNAAGEVIGINTAVSTSANGISFAIPISSVKGMLQNILQNNRVERAYIGARYTTITATVAKNNDLPVKSGAYIHAEGQDAVIKGSPADQAGLMDGDIITAINGEELGNHSLSSMIGEYMPGDTIQMTVLRSTGKEKILNVTLAAYPVASEV